MLRSPRSSFPPSDAPASPAAPCSPASPSTAPRRLSQEPRALERALPIAILALAIIGVPTLVLEPEGLPRMRALERELAGVTAENENLRRSVTELRGDVKRLRDDPAAVERIARDELGLVRKSEIVFQFPRAPHTN